MYVRELGKGPVVVLLHGTPSPAADWLPLAEALAPSYRVLVPDLPGYGRTPALADPTMERVGDALATMLAARGVGEVHAIAGYSSGAYRAFDLVLRHRIPCGLLVSLGGLVAFDDEARAARRAIAAALDRDPAYLRGAEVREVMRTLMLSPSWRARHPEDEARVIGWLDLTTAAALAAELVALADARDLRPELAGVTCPVYARVGTLDVGCPPAYSEDIVRGVPHGELELVDGCGHALLIEDHDATVAAIATRIRARGGDDAR